MPSNLPYKQAANVERRTWDKETYEKRAKARISAENLFVRSSENDDKTNTSNIKETKNNNAKENDLEKEEFRSARKGTQGPMNSKRAFLAARREKVDLESKVGTSEMINPDAASISSTKIATSTNVKDNFSGSSITDGVTKAVSGVGWHCKICDCFLKDSLTYLDHINGRKHQRALGYSMRIAKSTTDEVASKLTHLAEKQEQQLSENKRLSMIPNEESKQVNEFEKIVKKKDEEIEQRKADRKRRREERKRRIREEAELKDPGEEEDCGMDPDMATMMGFSGFR